MGYACPVCDEPQVDAEHLANHLAFTAILRSSDHEAWLEETVPDWTESGPEELGPEVAEHAEEVEMEIDDAEMESFEGRVGNHARQRRGGEDRLSDHDRAVLEEAREMTRKMLADADPESTDSETQ